MKKEVEAGEKSPEFSLFDQDGRKVSIADLKGKWVVLYFYPKDNTPGCTQEASDFTKILPELQEMKVAVLGVSPDSIKSHCNFAEKKKLKVNLLSDPHHEAIEKYHVWRKKKLYGREYEGVLRSTFIMDPKGTVAYAKYGVNVNGHAQEVKEMIEKLQKGVKK